MPENIEYKQLSFSGGMSQRLDLTRLERNKYPLLINGRNRFDKITPIKLPLQVTDGLPATIQKLQGVYGAGNFLLVFADGKCYYKDYNNMTTNFSQIVGFAMSEIVNVIYIALVPASTINYKRIPVTAGILNTDVNLTSTISGSSAAIVVQDGIRQPWVIFSDGTARETRNYSQWENAGIREYVPIGKQMSYQDGILHIMSPDGQQRYHSVTGRPLDFMVNIDQNGDKLATEELGGAGSVSDKVDFDITTCLGKLNDENVGLFQGTIRNSYNIGTLDAPEDLILGEPQFSHGYLFSAGPQNQFSFVELLGDYALIDLTGIRSFNAIRQYRIEGKNSPFSVDLGDILQDPSTKNFIVQDVTCADNFDNYALFAMKTKYDYAVIVYDTLSNSFVGLDIYANLTGAIKQFAQIKTNTSRMLFFITTDNKVYEAFTGETAQCQLYLGEFCTNDASIDQKPEQVNVVMSDAQADGTLYCTIFSDGKVFNPEPLSFPVSQSIVDTSIPVTIPFGAADKTKITNCPFEVGRSKQAWKIGMLLSWNFQVDLTHIYLGCSQTDTQQEKAANYIRTVGGIEAAFETMKGNLRNGN